MTCEGSCLQSGGLTLLLVSLPADSTTVAYGGIELERNNHLADFTNVINTVQKSRAVNSHP